MTEEINEVAPSFQVKIEPQLYAHVLHKDNSYCVPVVILGGDYVVFPDEKFEVLCFGHANKLPKALKIFDGSVEEYKKFRQNSTTQMFYALISDVFIARHYLEMVETVDVATEFIFLYEHFVDFLVFMCEELRSQDVEDVFIAMQLQKYMGIMLSEIEMSGLLYQVAPLIPRALDKFLNKTKIDRAQRSEDIDVDYMTEDFLDGLFGEDK